LYPLYDVRIALTDGWFRIEDRMSGVEIKRDATSKAALSNPYRAAALACLKKVVTEFHLDAQQQDFFGCIDALLNFHSLIADIQPRTQDPPQNADEPPAEDPGTAANT
jgi:hypothetical protein